ncbi:hypothetical protein [Gracilibacillus saliphilus]|uniref:hypothetical protein n=1 Tax=Gracilibacillus saliphilus TaxID=543890 RepID=UPI0013D6DBC2|nr:hypothetical protein [Gracilibacillus saliphilus]
MDFEKIADEIIEEEKTDAEILEEIKQRMKGFRKIKTDSNNMGMANIKAIEKSMNWLIQHVEELDREVVEERQSAIKVHQQNKRYEAAIHQAISHFNQDEHREGMKVLRQALQNKE